MLNFRVSSPIDGPSISEFCNRVLAVPAGSPVFSAEHLAWKYWRPWRSWKQARSYLLEENGRIVAHAGLVPLRFMFDGRELTFVQVIDWAAAIDTVGAGVALLKHVRALADGAVAVRGSETTRKLMRALGFRAVADSVRYARPGEGASPVGVQLRVYALGDTLPTRHPLEDAQSRVCGFVPIHSIEDVAHWLACPVVDAEYVEVVDEDVVGCFLLFHILGQVRIAHAWAQESGWNTVVKAACWRAHQRWNAREIVGQTNDPQEVAALVDAGFTAAGPDPLSVLASLSDFPVGAALTHHLVDTDLAYLHHGVPETWLS